MEIRGLGDRREKHEARRVYINVNGGQKRDYFAVILAMLRRINQSFEKLETKELIPMPDEPKVTASYQQLIRYEKRGIDVFLPGDSDNEYSVTELLGTIRVKGATEDEVLQILRKLKTSTDTIESLLKKAGDVISIKPSILGVSVDLKATVKKLFKKDES